MPEIELTLLKDGGFYAGQRPLAFWQAIASAREIFVYSVAVGSTTGRTDRPSFWLNRPKPVQSANNNY
jgi:hypothetical protein